ncbi:MAG: D-alanyl-D-alanine carboxypeptidase, partial [Gemmatimonadota bacterium]
MAKSSANHGHCSQAILKSLESIVSIFFAFCAFSAFSATPAHAQKALTRAVDARLDAAPYNRQLWGVALIDDQGKLLYGRNQDRLFIPASNTKIIVTAVATALMPPDWTVKTSVYSDGRIDAGVLTGDLVLYGRGDPTMTHHCYAVDTTVAGSCDVDALAKLRALADSLKAHGIRVVRGDLIGDGSYFEPQIVHPAWEAYDLNWWYAAPVSGLGFNDNSIDIKWGPGLEPGAPAQLSFTPDLGDVTLENRTATQSLPGDDIDFFREPSTLHLWAQGSVSSSSKGGTEYFALPDPNL